MGQTDLSDQNCEISLQVNLIIPTDHRVAKLQYKKTFFPDAVAKSTHILKSEADQERFSIHKTIIFILLIAPFHLI